MAEQDIEHLGETSKPVNKPHTVDEIVPSSVPLIIPYFEVYRTNELEYVDYISPFLSQNEEGNGNGESDEDSDSESSKRDADKKKKLKESITSLLDSYYPKLSDKESFINELMNDELTWASVAHTVNKMGNPSTKNQNFIIEQVMRYKEEYSGTTRRNYAQSKKVVLAAGNALNTKKGQVVIGSLEQARVWNGKSYTGDVALNKLGKTLRTISEKTKNK